MKSRVAFDTNVVISALGFEGRISVALRGRWGIECRPLISRDSVAELNRVLRYRKFGLSESDVEELLGDYIPHTELIENIQPAPRTCRDPKDQKFLDLAHSAQASLLVTGDEDLLVLAGQTTFKILTPADYLALESFDR